MTPKVLPVKAAIGIAATTAGVVPNAMESSASMGWL